MKYYLFFTLSVVSCSLFSQNVHIPDSNFKDYLLNNSSVNTNSDSEIQVSEATAFTGTLAFQFFLINDLTGIEAFTNLTILDCGDNNLTSLDLSANTALQQLYCYDNQLTSLNLSANTQLQALDCRDNQILNLDLSSNTELYYLQCTFNGMETLNVQNTALTTLRCYSNQLSSLDLSTNTALSTLLVYNNNLTELDLSSNASLTIMECQSNELTSLNIANTNNTIITTFDARNNPDLDCIQVDNEAYSTANWTSINGSTVFSEDCSLLSITDFNNSIDVSVFPNPVVNNLNIIIPESVAFKIISLNGQIIERNSLTKGNHLIDVSSLSQGIYYIYFETESNHTFSTRFVKK